MTANVGFGMINVGFALLFAALNAPLMMRRVKMNSFYGFRIKKSFESEKTWYAINAYAGKQAMLWSIPIFLAGLACFFVPIENPNGLKGFVAGIGPAGICLSIATARILAYAKRL